MTFTHVPVVVEPSTALALVRDSSLGSMLVADGVLLNTPTSEWYVRVEPVRASMEALQSVGVTASTWEPPRWDYRAAELTVRLVYADGERKANQELRLHASSSRPLSLSRWTYDQQRAGTGYEGEKPVFRVPADNEVADMLDLVQRLTGQPLTEG